MQKIFYSTACCLLFWSNAYNQPLSTTNGDQRLAAFNQQQAMLDASPYKNLAWRLTGPGNISGRATDIIGIPGNDSIMYAAFATGGVWKTADKGNHWQPIFDQQATLSIGNLAIAPSEPNILYVGTGEANIFRASLPGTGVYKTVDGGKSFQHVGLQNTGTIARIVVHPKQANTLWVAASGSEWTYNKERGVYRSIDGGSTWQQSLIVDEKTGCIDLVMDPQNPAILYASMWNRVRRRWSDPVPEVGDYLYKTIDGGITWQQIGIGLPDTKLTGRIGLAVAPSSPGTLYAFVDDHSIKRSPKPGETDSYERLVQKVVIGAAIYRSTDYGVHWEKRGEVHDFVTPFSGTYGWVFSQIRVHPSNPDELFAFGVNKVRSIDGGVTWAKFDGERGKGDYTHGDNHGFWIDPKSPERMLLANDGGVSMTMDAGKSWKNFFDKIPTTQFYTLAYDMGKPFNIFGSIQDEGTFSGSIKNTFGETLNKRYRSWTYAPGGEGTQIAVDPLDSTIVFSSSYYGRLMRTKMAVKQEGQQVKRIKNFAVGAIDSLRGEWLAGTIISKFNNQVVYHGLQHLYTSENQGETWQQISPDLTYNRADRKGSYPYLIYHQAITSIAEGTMPGWLYVGTDDGRIWSTKTNGKQWQEIGLQLPAYTHVAKITASNSTAGHLYAVLNNRRADDATVMIYASKDDGKTWNNIGANLPAAAANVLIEHPWKKGFLLCGTDLGIYISVDDGKNWAVINANMPASVAVSDMFFHPRDKTLVVATYGRGVYALDDISPL